MWRGVLHNVDSEESNERRKRDTFVDEEDHKGGQDTTDVEQFLELRREDKIQQTLNSFYSSQGRTGYNRR
uniref:Uncharacterized protein n=1 Tax=Timema shepardi TaxID=629360 RepID=A0A7R9FVD4_TIMSH|nr:unnamed protein product [Timema shepardi]